MTDHDRHLVTRFRSILERHEVSLHELRVFGSRARGDNAPDSDLDVLVVLIGDSDSARRVQSIVSDCAWEAALGSGVVIAPVVVLRQEWERGLERSSLLAQAVRQDGIAA